MINVIIQGKEYSFAEGIKLNKIAEQVQSTYEHQIILAMIDGRLKELGHSLHDDCILDFITTADKIGGLTYCRSVTFLMLRAFLDVAQDDLLRHIYVEYSIGNGLFCHVRGKEVGVLTPELVHKAEKRMHELVQEDIRFEKKSVGTWKAIQHFKKHGMFDKAKLFRYRRASETNLYRLGEYEDYHYAYMAYSTGILKYFRLESYGDGFVLLLPSYKTPTVVDEFIPLDKLATTLEASSQWSQSLNLNTVGDLNDWISAGDINDLILLQEAQMEKQIAGIASNIKESGKRLVMIAGPSSSGKTTFSHRLAVQLRAQGMRPHTISCDNYFLNREDWPKEADGTIDFETIHGIDIHQLNSDLKNLLAGNRVSMPTYNFLSGQREYKGESLQLGEEEVLIMEGIHCLNDELTPSLPKEQKFKIYISALTQLNIDEHNRIPTTDGRLLRRIVRDARTRGTSAAQTIEMWENVRRGEEKNIFPYQESADIMINSSLIYELAVLKQYAEPLLFQITEDAPEYMEAKRLLKFLDYFLSVPADTIPQNSLLREFVGGGCFRV